MKSCRLTKNKDNHNIKAKGLVLCKAPAVQDFSMKFQLLNPIILTFPSPIIKIFRLGCYMLPCLYLLISVNMLTLLLTVVNNLGGNGDKDRLDSEVLGYKTDIMLACRAIRGNK